jgi:hypothetical protein
MSTVLRCGTNTEASGRRRRWPALGCVLPAPEVPASNPRPLVIGASTCLDLQVRSGPKGGKEHLHPRRVDGDEVARTARRGESASLPCQGSSRAIE